MRKATLVGAAFSTCGLARASVCAAGRERRDFARRSRAAALVLVPLALAACDSGGKQATTGRLGGMGAVPRPAPAEVLRGFVAAARHHDSPAVWAALSPQTQRRLGRRGAASLGTRVGADAVVILNLRLTSEWAVAAVDSRSGAYAAALRAVGARWRLELGAPVLIEQLGNDSVGRVARAPAQLAAQIRAPLAPILDVGMWLDGRGFPLHSGGTSARRVSVYGIPPGPIRPGRHVVVAFARAGADAAAKAWTFTVAPRR